MEGWFYNLVMTPPPEWALELGGSCSHILPASRPESSSSMTPTAPANSTRTPSSAATAASTGSSRKDPEKSAASACGA